MSRCMEAGSHVACCSIVRRADAPVSCQLFMLLQVACAPIFAFLNFRQIVWDLQPGVRGIVLSLLGWFGGSFHGDLGSNRPTFSKNTPNNDTTMSRHVCVHEVDQGTQKMY